MIVFSPSLITSLPVTTPGRNWVELTTASAAFITLQNVGSYDVYIQATSGAQPLSDSGSIKFAPGSQVIGKDIAIMFPGVPGADRVWAYADRETYVVVSHGPSTHRTVTVGPSIGAEDLNAPIFGYQNFVTVAGVSADTENTLYPATNLANVSTAAFWRANDRTAQTIEIIINPVQRIDYVGIAAHNFATAGVSVQIETQEGLGDPWVEVIAEAIPGNDNALIFRFPEQTAYGVRINLGAANVEAQAAVIYAGKLLVSQRRIFVGHKPITLNRQIQVVNGQSESGNYLGRIITGSNLTTSVALSHLTQDWYRAYFDPFTVAAQTVPFFFGWRPYQYPAECAFAWLTNNPEPSNMLPNGMMQVDLEMAGIT